MFCVFPKKATSRYLADGFNSAIRLRLLVTQWTNDKKAIIGTQWRTLNYLFRSADQRLYLILLLNTICLFLLDLKLAKCTLKIRSFYCIFLNLIS